MDDHRHDHEHDHEHTHDHDHAHDGGHHASVRDRHTGDERRQELVRAAYEAIAERGLEGLRTRDIAARAGVNIATLHYYFVTKEDLIRGVVNYIHDEFTELARRVSATGATARERLRAELCESFEIKRDRPELQIVLHELFLRSLRDPAVHAIYHGMDTEWQADIETILREGIREGSFRTDLDLPGAASVIIAFIKGASIQLAQHPEIFDVERAAAEIEHWLSPTDRPHTSVHLAPASSPTQKGPK